MKLEYCQGLSFSLSLEQWRWRKNRLWERGWKLRSHLFLCSNLHGPRSRDEEHCVTPVVEETVAARIHICYSPAGRSVLGKTVPEVLDTARGRRPRAVLKTEGTVFPNTDRPRLVNNIFFFFFYNTTKGVRKTRTF